MAPKNLEQVLTSAGDTVKLLRNSQIGAYVYPVVPTEYSQLARRAARLARNRGAVRPVAPHGGVTVKGPDALKLLSYWRSTASPISRSTAPSRWCRAAMTATSSATASCSTSTQNESGVRRPRADGELAAVPGRDRASSRWTRSATTARRRIRAARRSSAATTAIQIQGPNAEQDHREAERRPDSRTSSSSTWTTINIKGRKVRALRHGMAGAPGLEIWGPYAERDEIRNADHGSRPGVRPARGGLARLRQSTRWSPAGFPRRCRPCTPARR